MSGLVEGKWGMESGGRKASEQLCQTEEGEMCSVTAGGQGSVRQCHHDPPHGVLGMLRKGQHACLMGKRRKGTGRRLNTAWMRRPSVPVSFKNALKWIMEFQLVPYCFSNSTTFTHNLTN